MSVEEQLRHEVRRYVEGESTLSGLRFWLSGHVQSLADSQDETARGLDTVSWVLISEYDLGWWNEEQIREKLRAELGMIPAAQSANSETVTFFGSSSAVALPAEVLWRLVVRPRTRRQRKSLNGSGMVNVQTVHVDYANTVPAKPSVLSIR
jgi:hypothetical protein